MHSLCETKVDYIIAGEAEGAEEMAASVPPPVTGATSGWRSCLGGEVGRERHQVFRPPYSTHNSRHLMILLAYAKKNCLISAKQTHEQ